jgi:hypothetical protein
MRKYITWSNAGKVAFVLFVLAILISGLIKGGSALNW